MNTFSSAQSSQAIAVACAVLDDRKEEVNRLNVFPVPDGDTGTNMSLTLKSVLENVEKLPANSSPEEFRRAIIAGALMGARGNSGVITSQILRGLCDGCGTNDELGINEVALAFQNSVDVAFKAVRKPVKGTILTVLEDSAAAAKRASKKKMSLEDGLNYIVDEAYASVKRTPDYLPVLKENGVVDAGGYGLAILIDAFISSILNKETVLSYKEIVVAAAPKVKIEQINDWEGSKYRYCNEFLVESDTLDSAKALDFLSTMGDCELCVGAAPKFKVHVHSNTPDKVLAYFLQRGQISEVFIHNMQLQCEDRSQKLSEQSKDVPQKGIGIVAVAAGSGNEAILKSMGVDVVVSGGQTMNPSTADLLTAIKECNAKQVIVLPNNSNIILAAQSAKELAEIPVEVVPSKSIPASLTSLFSFNQEHSLEENARDMTEALDEVQVGEVTIAIKDSKDAHDNPIKEGDYIGIADGSIEAVGKSMEEVILSLLSFMHAEDADTITLLAGEDLTDDQLDLLSDKIQETFEDAEIDKQRGEQPLYPLIFAVE